MTVLAAPAGLADEAPFGIGGAMDGLAIRHLRASDVGVDVELALHAIDDDLEVQLAHARDQGLAGLLVTRHPERRILLGQALQAL